MGEQLDERDPWSVGATVAVRSIRDFPDRGLTVSFAVAGIVLHDDADLSVVATAPGSGMAQRSGPATGPRGRNVSPVRWDGRYSEPTWRGPSVVRVHRRGDPWSLWRWHDGTGWTRRWYGNLETPWRRSAAGFDTQDWALDVVAEGAPGTDDWTISMKDEDELDWYAQQGTFSPEKTRYIREVGEELRSLLEKGLGAAGESWDRWVPGPEVVPVPLPETWRDLDPSGNVGFA